MTANAFGPEHVRAAVNGEENTGVTPGEEVRTLDCLAGQGVLYRASTVLGGLDAAHEWLETPLPAMGGQRPADSSCVIDLHKVGLLLPLFDLPCTVVIPQALLEDPLVFLPDRELRQRLHRLRSGGRRVPELITHVATTILASRCREGLRTRHLQLDKMVEGDRHGHYCEHNRSRSSAAPRTAYPRR